jgi:hypothetical protein
LDFGLIFTPKAFAIFSSETLFSFVVRAWLCRRGFPAGREKRSNNEANPPFGRARRSFGINFRAKPELHRLLADLDQLTNEKIDRDGPLLVVPVISAFCV